MIRAVDILIPSEAAESLFVGSRVASIFTRPISVPTIPMAGANPRYVEEKLRMMLPATYKSKSKKSAASAE